MIPAGILAFFALPIVFYGFSAALIIGFFVAAAFESLGGAAFALLLASAFGVVLAGSIPAAIAAIVANWVYIVGACVAFIPLSILWARFRWSLFTSDKLNEIKNKIEEVGPERAAKFFGRYDHVAAEILKSNFRNLAPKVRDNKSRITIWIALCIPDAIWFMLHDPITRFANWAYTAIREWFQAASDEKFQKAFAVKEEPVPPTIEDLEDGAFEERR